MSASGHKLMLALSDASRAAIDELLSDLPTGADVLGAVAVLGNQAGQASAAPEPVAQGVPLEVPPKGWAITSQMTNERRR